MTQTDLTTLIGLVSQYSPSGKESGAVEWLVERMKTLGYDRAFTDKAGNAVGIRGEGIKQIVLLGHIDTVPGEIEIKRKAGRLYGRGAVDAKGPLACFVDAVARIDVQEGWQIVVIGAVEEERDSDGARFTAEEYKPDFAIIGEPSRWDRIALGYKGSAWSEVTVKCAQSHPASGKKTVAEEAVDVWSSIKSYTDDFNADKKKLFDKLLLTLSGITSSSDDFEQIATLKIGVRLPVDIPPDDWFRDVKDIINESGISNIQIVPTGFAIPAWKSEKNTPLVRAFLKGIRQQGGEPRFVYKTGTADINIVAPAWECPAVVYGPGDSALDHTPDEYLELDEYSKAIQILIATIESLFSE